MSQTVQTQFGTGTVVDHEVIRGRVSYKVEGPGFSTWIEAAAMPLDFQMMPHPDDVQDNSVTLPYNPSPQSWVNPADQNIVPGEQAINPEKRTAPADSVDFQADGESYEPGPDPKLFATAGLDPEDIQAKLGPKYVNAFVEHDFTSLQARIDENPELVMAEYRERVAELVAQADQEYLERIGRNEHLEASDHHIREAAWKDVRAKAVRLRHSGQVMTHAANPDVIATQVTGDHGTYEVMVIRSNIFQGSSAVDSWTCECPWGQWAFQRSDKFMGRLCSHAYASLLELQAMTRSKTHNPRFRNSPGIGFDPSILRNRRRSSRTAEMVDIRPVGWDPYSRSLMNRLRDLWEEGSRPGREKERNEEVRELVQELRDRGFATDGIMAAREGSFHTAWNDHPNYPEKDAQYIKKGNSWGIVYRRESPNGDRWFWSIVDSEGNQRDRDGGGSNSEESAKAEVERVLGKYAFLDRPMGYGDIPDYGTSEDYIADHEMWKREDVTEPEFEYSAGGDHGVINDLNDGGGGRTAAFLPEGTPVNRLTPSGDLSGTTGVIARDYDDPEGWAPVVVKWNGEHGNSQEDLSLISWDSSERTADVGWEEDYSGGDEFDGDEDPFYVDPMEREDWPEDDIVANFQRNAGWIMGENSESSGGNDDIAAAAAAHLRTAGRNFTMAEQQALIDEDDGQPYDRSQLDLRGTHYI